MKIKDDEYIAHCNEFQYYYQFSIFKNKTDEDFPGSGRFIALKKDFKNEINYYTLEEASKIRFGTYIKELNEKEIDNILEMYEKEKG